MPSPEEARRALVLVADTAVRDATKLVGTNPDRTRDALLAATPEIVTYYSDGTAALAADHYDDLRADANAPGRFSAEPVVRLRQDKIRTGTLWAVEPLYRPEPDQALAIQRIADVIQLETARPFRDTITTNTRRDPASVGWQRIAGGGCRLCSMLAARGAVYKQSTARFATHPSCKCSAAPVFAGQPGEEASAIQYVASQRKRTPAQQRALREYLSAMP